MFENPFTALGQWYKANLHAHTTNSDGDLTPEACVDFYHQAGYHVLAITDHWCVTEAANERVDFLLIPGAELNGGYGAQGIVYDIVGLNLPSLGKIERRVRNTAQKMIDWINESGGAAYLAHPYWTGLMAPDMLPLEGCFALEVYNSGCDTSIRRGYSSVQWDDVLTLGKDWGGLAVDDGHRRARDHGLGWTMIKAEALSVSAVMESLRRGRYYASTGPTIEEIRVDGDQIYIRTSPAASIALVSQPTWGSCLAMKGKNRLTEVTFPLPRCRYSRVEVVDHEGKMAWSNPLLRAEYADSLGRTPWS